MLKYLFAAYLNDGTVIRQTPEDISVRRSDKSAWWDVMERIDEVTMLVLLGPDGSAGVNLTDGSFSFRGQRFRALPFSIEDQDLAGGRYRPQYFRQRIAHNDTTSEPKILGYAIGWEYIVNEKVVAKQVIVLD